MSQENLELHERGVEALNARVLSNELAAETLAPGFRIENAATAVTDKTYYGAEGVREWVRDIFEGLDEDEVRRPSRGRRLLARRIATVSSPTGVSAAGRPRQARAPARRPRASRKEQERRKEGPDRIR